MGTLRLYNITLKQYNEMLEKQRGCCFLCGKPEVGRSLCVDHNHQTGKIRGLLCTSCNLIVGILENSPDLIQKMLKYLDEK